MMLRFSPLRVRRVVVGLSLLAASIGFAPSPAIAESVPTAGTARVWFYRVFFPDDTGGMPAVALNDTIVGYARAGFSFYRDVPAGPYHITVASIGVAANQAKDVVLSPGEELHVAIQSDPSWMEDFGGARNGGTYYVGFEPLEIAAIHLGQMRLGNGG